METIKEVTFVDHVEKKCRDCGRRLGKATASVVHTDVTIDNNNKATYDTYYVCGDCEYHREKSVRVLRRKT